LFFLTIQSRASHIKFAHLKRCFVVSTCHRSHATADVVFCFGSILKTPSALSTRASKRSCDESHQNPSFRQCACQRLRSDIAKERKMSSTLTSVTGIDHIPGRRAKEEWQWARDDGWTCN
jgi:hypothetical protein